jgi:hypothetical protein
LWVRRQGESSFLSSSWVQALALTGVRVARFREVTPMSQSECERFEADLQANAAMRAEVGKALADKSHEPLLAGMVAFAVSKGYSVTLAEAREHVKTKAAAAGKVLSDADLDGVAAGADLTKFRGNYVGDVPGMPAFNF